jgi:hypothetical protein
VPPASADPPASPPGQPHDEGGNTIRDTATRRARQAEPVEGNARLTASAAAVLFVLLAAEGVTILSIHRLLSPHVAIGMVLVPVVAVKMGSTFWRFVRYYRGDPEYRRKGPPPLLLRLLGPFVVVLTVAVLATGIALLYVPVDQQSTWLFLHRATFVLWFGAMALHVLGHLLETARLAPRDFVRRTRRQVRGASARQWLLAASLVLGVLLAVAVLPKVGGWNFGGFADSLLKHGPPPAVGGAGHP